MNKMLKYAAATALATMAMVSTSAAKVTMKSSSGSESKASTSTGPQFGAKTVLGMSTFTGDDASFELDENTKIDPGMKFNFSVGGFAIIPAGPILIQPELLFSMKGVSYEKDIEGSNSTFSASDNLSYIDIPVLIKLPATPQLNIFAGPYVSILLSSEIDYEYEGLTADEEAAMELMGMSTSESFDWADGTSGLDVGLTAGLGFNINSSLMLDARFNMGFTTIDNGKEPVFNDEGEITSWEDSEEDPDDVKNMSFGLGIGYAF
jgi:hypothetical protein